MSDSHGYDAILIVSFGGPEGPDDVMPFLENVTRGRNIPRQRLEEVAEHYLAFGGVSPINEQCRGLIERLERLLEREGPRLPVYWGNRNWHPMLTDTVARMREDGVRRAVAYTTSAFSSYSSCRQYLENIEAARVAVGAGAPEIEKIRPFWNHPGFIEANASHGREAVAALAAGLRVEKARLVFSAHSIPVSMATGCDYERQLREASRLVAERIRPGLEWDLVFQSRSGPPQVPWLEPDVCDHLHRLADEGVEQVVLVPIGFVSDHMEVIYDLDTEAVDVARERGIELVRASTVDNDPQWVVTVRDLLLEHMEGRRPALVGDLPASQCPCPQDCCTYTPARRPD